MKAIDRGEFSAAKDRAETLVYAFKDIAFISFERWNINWRRRKMLKKKEKEKRWKISLLYDVQSGVLLNIPSY